VYAVLLAGALVLEAGCQRAAAFEHTQTSPEAVAAAVLDALARHDVERLRALALTEREFRESVWPQLPAARPERNLPFSYVWGDLRQKSEQSLARTVAREGGRRYTLVSVRNDGKTTRYSGYTVRRDTVLSVRNDSTELLEIRVFGSLIEQNGRWKVFSYVVND
jgi:hypothetical protein